MATEQFTKVTRDAPVKKSKAPQKSNQAQALRRALYAPAGEDLVKVPVLRTPYKKAPAVDPHLVPETVTSEIVSIGDVSLPPILRGIQRGQGLGGEPKDYSVKVVWASRRQIDAVLHAIEQEHPETRTVMEVVRSFLCNLDTMRSEASLQASSAASSLRCDPPKIDQALASLNAISGMCGRWNDERRLHL
ncbi:hypothetical protein [Variovorax sp.]|uniref:hypothetical protein n=1 Tax=Variovorax sp. TaxID=1871043 RepID=UPI003BAA9CD0